MVQKRFWSLGGGRTKRPSIDSPTWLWLGQLKLFNYFLPFETCSSSLILLEIQHSRYRLWISVRSFMWSERSALEQIPNIKIMKLSDYTQIRSTSNSARIECPIHYYLHSVSHSCWSAGSVEFFDPFPHNLVVEQQWNTWHRDISSKVRVFSIEKLLVLEFCSPTAINFITHNADIFNAWIQPKSVSDTLWTNSC